MKLDFGSGPKKPLAAPGVYGFTAKASDDVSKTGIPMVTIRLAIQDDAGVAYEVRDWFGPWGTARIQEFCLATGKLQVLQTGELKASMIDGAKGRAVIGVRPDDGFYQAKNFVKTYMALALTADQFREQIKNV
jgi:hypothetical protein